MFQVKAKDGSVLSSSRNLRGIRTVAGRYVIEGLSIRHAQCGAYLDIQFEHVESNGRYAGATYHADFADFSVLCGFVAAWRNVYGAPLYIDGRKCGEVSRNNPK